MKLNWNFLGGRGCKTKKLLSGEYGYFLELHIAKLVADTYTCITDITGKDEDLQVLQDENYW